MKSKTSPETVQVDVHDMLSIMRYRCGDLLDADDYRRLDALMRPGEKWPRRKDAPLISDLPAYCWNKRELAEVFGMTAVELEEVVTLPGVPRRMANGRWPCRKIAEFLVSYMEDHA